MPLDSYMEQHRLGEGPTRLLVPTMPPPSLSRNFAEISRHAILMMG